MADKRMNPLLIGGVALAIGCLSLVMCSKRQEAHQPVDQVPGYDPGAKPQDGDTQTDTIKALQAYAREAVKKADKLNASTKDNMGKVLENQQKVSRLETANKQAQETLDETKVTITTLQHNLSELKRELADWQKKNPQNELGALNQEGLPAGFGFDGKSVIPVNPDQGAWYNPIDFVEPDTAEGNNSRFTGLLPRSPASAKANINDQASQQKKPIVVEPIYTLPKDATLTDGLALTALIGRIPVEGQTPDPYPIKIYIGKENLLANGHDLPEVEGMIFSGLGFGDWNLSCVSARLTSATFIFEDGSIVNHSSQGKPLGYISDPSGVPCVAGRFVTNATSFITQRVGLAGLGAAGSAYAEAQQQRQTSSLTGSTTSTVVGDINKLVAGEAVQSATDEVSRWLLARQKQSFDAVVVNPGAAISVHLDRSLPLDKSSMSRRLRYAKEDSHTNRGLD
jgi:integrating conjugative element protein (TIGR03752 family)